MHALLLRCAKRANESHGRGLCRVRAYPERFAMHAFGSLARRWLSAPGALPPGASRQTRTPAAAAWLTAGGVVPFVWFAAQHSPDAAAPPRGDALLARLPAAARALAAPLRAGDQDSVRRAFVGYGAVILSFLGAVHWGAAMVAPAPTPAPAPALRYAGSVLPALAGWAALRCLEGSAAAPGSASGRDRLPHVLLAAGFFAVYGADEALVRARALPGWYSFVRTPATLAAVGSCLAAARLAAPADARARGGDAP